MRKEKIRRNKNKVPIGMIIMMGISIIVIGIALFKMFFIATV